jgi:putative acetyltransferase
MTDGLATITPFAPGDGSAFASLNRAWLVGFDLLEPKDEAQLADPRTHVFDHGGEIFIARFQGVAVGCCAAIPRGDGSMEVAKLAVDDSVRGRGIGRRLLNAALTFGRERGYHTVVLTSNHRLEAALRLYESVGFRYAPLPPGTGYHTADVYMELDLTTWSPAEQERSA